MELSSVLNSAVDRTFTLNDDNVEVTSLDIACHGAFIVAGTSSGLILLFDVSNPYEQRDGMLIGQIRAKGMHTNLILSVRFSEDGRFVFAGVTKGSSEMLAIDLGKLLVEWSEDTCTVSKASNDFVQQLQQKSLVTFNYSDAKLRGFGAVARIRDAPMAHADHSFHVCARYRLACGRGIKNVHIWHFTVGVLASDAVVDEKDRMLHGKWEYVCDVASNGNTITHVEFRNNGTELLSKSAGVCVRVWELQAAPGPSGSCEEGQDAVKSNGSLLRSTYNDVANSQDIKCLLPVGLVAYGGTYQFAVLNTAAPREANRDVLELPERFSGDAVAVPAPSALTASVGRGRRITREIEQVVSTESGQHVLIMCADGGVVYYGSASVGATDSAGVDSAASAVLMELPTLSRGKDQQQHPGSWTLRRVGAEGWLVLLRATPNANAGGVSVECRLLSEYFPDDALRSALEMAGWESSAGRDISYYVDPTYHAEQQEARKAWRRTAGASSVKTLSKRLKVPSKLGDTDHVQAESGDVAFSAVRGRRKAAAAPDGKSPACVADVDGSAFITPAAAPAVSNRHNRISPYEDATARLAGSVSGAMSPTAAPTQPARRSRLATAGVFSTSQAKLRALRDDDAGDEPVTDGAKEGVSKHHGYLHHQSAECGKRVCGPLELGPAPKVKRLQIVPFAMPPRSGALTMGPQIEIARAAAVDKVLREWTTSTSDQDDVVMGKFWAPLGACALQRLGMITAEQQRLRDQYVREVSVGLRAVFLTVRPLPDVCATLTKTYRGLSMDMVLRQQQELRGACASDWIVAQRPALELPGPTTALAVGSVRFRYDALFATALALPRQVAALLE